MNIACILADSSQKEDQNIIKESIKIFADQLETNWTRKRAPQKLRLHLLNTLNSEATVTARIFLEHGGFRAYVAYFLATHGKAHFHGRQNRAKTIATFLKLSLSDRIGAARKVADIRPHRTASGAIDNISAAFIREGMPTIHWYFAFFNRIE